MNKKKKTIEELLEETLVSEEENPYEVPKNWIWTKLGNLVRIETGKKDANHGTDDGKYPFFTCASQPIKSETYSFEGDSIILPGNGANVGLVLYYEGKFEAYQRTYVLNEFQGDMKYLYYQLLFGWKAYNNDKQYGSATNYIKLGNITQYMLPLPPKKEQKRIVDKVEPFLNRIEEAKQLVEEAKETFELRRAAILDKAFRGELTGKWREDNSTAQSFDDLLEKIRNQKEKVYLELLNKSNEKGSKKPTRSKKFDNKINQEVLISLPNNWGYCTLGDVIYDFKYGTSEKSDYNFKGTPVIRIPNIGEEFINIEDLKYLKANSINNATVSAGDILIVRSNGSKDLVGKCSIVQESEENYSFASYLIRLRPVLVEPEFILWLLKSDKVKGQFFSKSKSSAGINNINSEELATTIIPLPPLEEQREIVNRVKSLLAKETETKSILELDNYIGILKQSILSKAFRGELGTNDPIEENAFELLKEVLNEKVK